MAVGARSGLREGLESPVGNRGVGIAEGLLKLQGGVGAEAPERLCRLRSNEVIGALQTVYEGGDGLRGGRMELAEYDGGRDADDGLVVGRAVDEVRNDGLPEDSWIVSQSGGWPGL